MVCSPAFGDYAKRGLLGVNVSGLEVVEDGELGTFNWRRSGGVKERAGTGHVVLSEGTMEGDYNILIWIVQELGSHTFSKPSAMACMSFRQQGLDDGITFDKSHLDEMLGFIRELYGASTFMDLESLALEEGTGESSCCLPEGISLTSHESVLQMVQHGGLLMHELDWGSATSQSHSGTVSIQYWRRSARQEKFRIMIPGNLCDSVLKGSTTKSVTTPYYPVHCLLSLNHSKAFRCSLSSQLQVKALSGAIHDPEFKQMFDICTSPQYRTRPGDVKVLGKAMGGYTLSRKTHLVQSSIPGAQIPGSSLSLLFCGRVRSSEK
eukprot:scaffold26262_cov37-Prasinocladus_malaysianus.AAC.1